MARTWVVRNTETGKVVGKPSYQIEYAQEDALRLSEKYGPHYVVEEKGSKGTPLNTADDRFADATQEIVDNMVQVALDTLEDSGAPIEVSVSEDAIREKYRERIIRILKYYFGE